MTAGAARILAQRVAHDANRRQPRLHDLDRVVARGGAREDDHRRLAVERRPRPGAAGVEITLDEEPAGLGMRAERDRRHLVAVGSGGHRVGHRRRQRAQPEIEQQIDRHVVARRRRRLLRGQHRARRDHHGERPEAALVHGIERRRQALDQHPAGADRDRVATVERSLYLRVRAREVDGHTAVGHGDRHLDAHRPVQRDAVVVEVADGAIDAGGDPGQRVPRAALGLLHVDARRLQHGVAAVLGEDLAKEGITRPAHREHGLDVLERATLGADVAGDDPHDLFAQLAAAHQADRAEAEPFLAKIGRAHLHATRHRTADVAPVGLHRHETGEMPFPEHGRRHRDVVQVVAVAGIRIVVDEHVAFAEGVDAAVRDGRLDRKPEVPLEDGQPDALRDHLHVGIEDRAPEIEAFADDVVVRGLDHRDPHALGRGVERGPDDLGGDVVDCQGEQCFC